MSRPIATPVRLPNRASLTDPASLEPVLGPVRELTIESLYTNGYSGSRHDRLHVVLESGSMRTLILKTVVPSRDWTCMRMGALRAPEAMVLETASLDRMWEGFACPYLAFAEDEDLTAGVLMEDLTEFLFPDVREPVSTTAEDALLGSLARLHATFWQSAPELPWLGKPSLYATLLGPDSANDPLFATVFPLPILEAVAGGWRTASERMPQQVRERLSTPVEVLAEEWARLPYTLVHGDAKVANFALHPGGRVSAFDWAWVGRAPASVDLGFYLAVNATRLAESKETATRLYRSHLERALGWALSSEEWDGLERAAVLIGARMLLWSKANALAAGRPGAESEWDWWMSRLSGA